MGQIYNLYVNNFAQYGLNNRRNFLSAPICECGCGQKMHVCLKTDEELNDFIGSMLYEHECNNCAIFAVTYDGVCKAGVKYLNEDDEPVVNLLQSKLKNDMDMFGELDGEFMFHCYGLIIENEPGLWDIQE